MTNWLRAYLTRSRLDPRGSDRVPVEVVVLRSLGLLYLALFILATVTTRPYPGLQGRGLAVLLAGIAVAVAAVAVAPPRHELPASRRIAWLLVVTAASALLAYLQPKGIWQAGPYSDRRVRRAERDPRAAGRARRAARAGARRAARDLPQRAGGAHERPA